MIWLSQSPILTVPIVRLDSSSNPPNLMKPEPSNGWWYDCSFIRHNQTIYIRSAQVATHLLFASHLTCSLSRFKRRLRSPQIVSRRSDHIQSVRELGRMAWHRVYLPCVVQPTSDSFTTNRFCSSEDIHASYLYGSYHRGKEALNIWQALVACPSSMLIFTGSRVTNVSWSHSFGDCIPVADLLFLCLLS